jgi:hypothetical protein
VRGRPGGLFSRSAIDVPLGFGVPKYDPKPRPIGETMAVAELIVSRRALLAAACAPLLSRHPGLDPGSRNNTATPARAAEWTDSRLRGDDVKWRMALARYRAAEAALTAAAHIEDETRYDRLGARHDAALKRLLRTSAQGLLAFAFKLELAIEHQAWELTGGDLCLAALKQDIRRLASAHPAPPK